MLESVNRLIVAENSDGSARFERLDANVPLPGRHHALVQVKAIGLNRADLNFRTNHFEHLASPFGRPVLGLELAGTVVALGDDVPATLMGQRVMAMCNSACAEFNIVSADLLMPVPAHLSLIEAAVVPVTYLTAHDALVDRGRLESGETVLVHAASSGVGLATAQLARLLGASRIFGTTTSEAKRAQLLRLGFDCILDARTNDFPAQILDVTSGRGVDVAIDPVAGEVFERTMRSLAVRGRYVNVGKFGGVPSTFDFIGLTERRLTISGASLRLRRHADMAKLVADFVTGVLDVPSIAGGIRPALDRVFPLARTSDAIDYMRRNTHIGKIAVTFEAPNA